MIEASLLTGVVVGVSIAAPFGPSSMLCVQRALHGGAASGLACGLGVATVHLLYGTLSSLGGLTSMAGTAGSLLFTLVSSLTLMLFAVRALTREVVLAPPVHGRLGLAATYAGALAFGLFNPITPLMFIAMSPMLLANSGMDSGLAVAGIFLGSAAWWSLLTAIICHFRGGLSPNWMRMSNKASGLLLAAMAVLITARTWWGGA